MDATAMLAMLKIDLGITATAYDARLSQYLDAAADEIKREGASTLDASSSLSDAQLVIQYAAYMWRSRDYMFNGTAQTGDKSTGMPRFLRYAINNRIFAEKAGGE